MFFTGEILKSKPIILNNKNGSPKRLGEPFYGNLKSILIYSQNKLYFLLKIDIISTNEVSSSSIEETD